MKGAFDMEKKYIKQGRFIPASGAATEAERLRAVELFLMRFSEEIEYAMVQLNDAWSAQTASSASDGEVIE